MVKTLGKEELAFELANTLTRFQKQVGIPIPPDLERVEIMRTILGWMGCPQPPVRGKMSYADLVRFAHGHGKQERDVLRYFAYVQAHFILEQTDEELIEGILEGSFAMSVKDVKDDWEEHTLDEQDEIIPAMMAWWFPSMTAS